jgi:3-hydroxyisobutyrate dehydrogenase
MKIGFIGTGLMGNPMASRLIEAGYSLSIFNRTLNKTENLEKKGAEVYTSPAGVISASEVIFLMLTDGNAVKEMLTSVNDYSEKVIIQMSTISPEESKYFERIINNSNGKYFEAPVLGSIKEAQEGKLFVMIGGEEQLYKSNMYLFKIIGEPYFIGEVGKAAALKLAFNQLIGALISAFALSLGIVLKENISVDVFMNILKRSLLFAPTFEKKLDFMLSGNFDLTNFPTKHLLKDINLIINEAKKLGIETSTINSVKKILQKAVDMGLAEKDYSSLFKAIVT